MQTTIDQAGRLVIPKRLRDRVGLVPGKVEVTAHNHGFAVGWPDGVGLDQPVDTPFGRAHVSHVNLNDDVVEGLELRTPEGELTAFSVQYHPEAAAGPHDAAYLFDRFVSLLEGSK